MKKLNLTKILRNIDFYDSTEIRDRGRIQYVIRFENGYGASIIRDRKISYGYKKGFWELAVIKFSSENNYEIVYDTPLIDDVLVLKKDELEEVLQEISSL